MARARTKAELLSFGEKEFERLIQLINTIDPAMGEELIIFDDRKLSDVIMHLVDWQNLLFGWLETANRGENPAIPGEGYKWSDLPAFNQALYEKSKGKTLTESLTLLGQSHKQAMAMIHKMNESDLEEKGKFKSFGTSNLASYFASVTSSHYVWAIDLIRKATR